MSYNPSNAATEIVKQIATQLDSNGTPILLGIVNNDSTPPTGSGLTQAQWDALKLVFNLKNAQAPVDGWLKPATEGQATVLSFNAAPQSIPGNSSYTTLTASAWSPTLYAPRAHVLAMSLSGWNSGTPGGRAFYQTRFDGNVIATNAVFFFNQTSVHHALPTLFGIIPASQTPYPLAAKQIDVQVSTDTNCTFQVDTNDVVSYAIF